MADPQVTLPPDPESVSANRGRERFLVRVGGVCVLVAIVSIWLSSVLQSWELLSLLMVIFGVSCLGFAGFAVLAILWRRACGWRGHSFRETDVFPGGGVSVYECRHCGEHRFVTHETAPTPNQAVPPIAPMRTADPGSR